MKKTTYILIVLLIFSSCQYEKKLNGTWIGAYSYSTNDTIKTVNYPAIRKIITFKNNRYFATGFKYDYSGQREKGRFEISSNTLYLKGENNYQQEIVSINSDSLIIKGEMGKMKSVYKKLSPKLKKESNDEINLIGEIFAINVNGIRDTIYFKSDSILVRKSNKNRLIGWKRIKHSGYDLIFVGLSAPWIIRKQNDKFIFLTSYYRTKNEFKLKKLNKNVW